MAITFQTSGTPHFYQPVYNPVTFTVRSTNTGQSNFQYIFDVYVNGSADYVRVKKPADPTANARAFIDLAPILKDYLSKNIDKNSVSISQNTTSYASYILKVGEEYGVSSGVTVYQDQLVDSTRYVWNGVQDPRDARVYTQNDWVFRASNTTGKFLTTHPDSLKIRNDEYRWIYFITSGTNITDYIQIKTYNSSNALLQTVHIDNPYTVVSTGSDMFLRCPSGYLNLNQVPGAQISNGAQPIMTASVDHFTIRAVFDDGFTQSNSSELRTFYVNTPCTPYETYTFHFLNDMGGYDTFTTIRRSDHETTAERKQFKRILGGITSSTGWTYLNADRGRINYNTTIKDRITVSSDWVTEAEAEWLEQMIYSPDVYLDDSTYNLISVNIIQDSYKREKQINSKLIQVTFSFEYSFNRTRQTSI